MLRWAQLWWACERHGGRQPAAHLEGRVDVVPRDVGEEGARRCVEVADRLHDALHEDLVLVGACAVTAGAAEEQSRRTRSKVSHHFLHGLHGAPQSRTVRHGLILLAAEPRVVQPLCAEVVAPQVRHSPPRAVVVELRAPQKEEGRGRGTHVALAHPHHEPTAAPRLTSAAVSVQ